MPLAFPSGLPEEREIPFRDGNRLIPEYLADLMVGLDTIRYTYTEAVAQVSNRLTNDHVNQAFDKIISNHFKEGFG